jgi:ribosomal subunit interface protein
MFVVRSRRHEPPIQPGPFAAAGSTARGVSGARGPPRIFKREEFSPMHVLITARHLNLKPETKTYAEEKAGKLVKYYDLIQEIEVTIDNGDKNGFHVEMIVNAEHRNMFVANARGDSIEGCIDACHDKLERQLSEHKARHRNRKHPESGVETSTIRRTPV